VSERRGSERSHVVTFSPRPRPVFRSTRHTEVTGEDNTDEQHCEHEISFHWPSPFDSGWLFSLDLGSREPHSPFTLRSRREVRPIGKSSRTFPRWSRNIACPG